VGIPDRQRNPYWTIYITDVLVMVSVLAGMNGTRNGNA
jgi:hypothetical protein